MIIQASYSLTTSAWKNETKSGNSAFSISKFSGRAAYKRLH